MATPAAPIEHTTELAPSEKRKLVKSLGHLDMVFFTVCEQAVNVPLAATPAPAAGD